MIKQDNLTYQISEHETKYLDLIHDEFNDESAQKVKQIEKTTNHDVKAVEYYIKERLEQNNMLNEIKEYVHFCCTSEDINNIAYSLIMKDAKEHIILPLQDQIIKKLKDMSEQYSEISMISRTHGQYASTTTVGKEIANYCYRLSEQFLQLNQFKFKAKLNGAVGNFNAHLFVYPEFNWYDISRNFIESQNLKFNPYTTQIESHDSIAEFYNSFSLFNSILLGFNKDMWHYISLGYFKQKVKKQEIGSSTMPHKVNPIDFENSEGNLGMANSIMRHMSDKLVISRYQRDLSDSTVMRNNGLGFGYSQLAYKSLIKGLDKLEVNQQQLEYELDQHWEILAEPIQMLMRKHNVHNAYEKLKDITRGKNVDKDILHQFISTLDIPIQDKLRMYQLTPANYRGNSIQMAKNIHQFIQK